MRNTATTTATVLLVLAGCGSEPTTPSPEDIAASASAAARDLAGDVKTADGAPVGSDGRSELPAIAKAIGCELTYIDASEDSPLTREYGTCVLADGASVQLYRFGTTEVIDTFWQASAAFGATPDQCAARDLIVVCPQAADLAAVTAALR